MFLKKNKIAIRVNYVSKEKETSLEKAHDTYEQHCIQKQLPRGVL